MPIAELATYPASAGTDASRKTVALRQRDWTRLAQTALKAAAASWFIVAVIGQLVFVAYMAGFYGRTSLLGQLETWNRIFPRAYVHGDIVRNLAVSAHLLMTTIVVAGGALQLIPALRRRWPRFHRWNGRMYLLSALGASVAGLILVWTRTSTGGDVTTNIAISINAVLIGICAGLAFHHARARRIDMHRRWALRLYLTMLGAWFFRVGLMFWLIVNRGPVGFDPAKFEGPFITFLSFAQYLLPLAVLELYLRARDHGGTGRLFVVAAGLFVLTLATAVGVFGASMMLWLPHMQGN